MIESFQRALEIEIDQTQGDVELETLYLGGGTPTQLPADTLIEIIRKLQSRFPLARDYELTIEANPADLTQDLAERLRDVGVNRLSLGVQSFNDEKLNSLDRDHVARDSSQSVEIAQRHFDSVSIDLIFNAPGESDNDWTTDISRAIGAKTNHVSTYSLTFEKGTSFWRQLQSGEVVSAAEEEDLCRYSHAIEQLSAAGFEHYEVSNFAIPGHRSRHNEVYWSGKPYLALGPGASRFLNSSRETNHRSTRTYINRLLAGKSATDTVEALTARELAIDRLVFGLRRLEGLQEAEFAAEMGFSIDDLVGDALKRFVEYGLFQRQQGCLKLTRKGLLVSDSIWPDFLD